MIKNGTFTGVPTDPVDAAHIKAAGTKNYKYEL